MFFTPGVNNLILMTPKLLYNTQYERLTNIKVVFDSKIKFVLRS